MNDRNLHSTRDVSGRFVRSSWRIHRQGIAVRIMHAVTAEALHIARGVEFEVVVARAEDLDDPSTEWNEFEYYQNYLAFSRLTHWDEFLDAFINGE